MGFEDKEKSCGCEESGDEKDKNGNMKRNECEASLCEIEDEREDEEGNNIELAPQCALKEQFERTKDDESLRKWKERLLGNRDINDVGESLEPDVKIVSLSILSLGRSDIVLPIPQSGKLGGCWFTLKEGSRYSLRFSFQVSHTIFAGLKYSNKVRKTGVKVDSTKEMLGTFSPQAELYTYEMPEGSTPSGYFARGTYSAKSKFSVSCYKMSKTNGKTAIGIDLGTTYSCVAAWFDKHDRVEIIPNEQGNKITPSCVAWDGTRILVGEAAKNQIHRNTKNTVFDVKRLIGRVFSDCNVHEDIESWPFKVIEGPMGTPLFIFEHESQQKKFSPQDISALILKNLKETAEAYLGTKVTDAVISVPAYFNNLQRQETKVTGKLAGLNVMRLINEPTSAAIAYGLDKRADIDYPNDKIVFIFDMGGGTLDVSLLIISKIGTITVKAVGGDTHLGGEDLDNAMVNYCVQEFRKKENKDVSNNARAMMRLKVACEKAKRDLSSTTKTSIEIDSFYEGIDFSMQITRKTFEELNATFFIECIKHVENCLKDGNMHKKDIDDVVIVGGSTRVPKVQQILGDFFDGKALCKSINADEAIAYGAAVWAANLCGYGNKKVKDLVILDVAPCSFGVNIYGQFTQVMIPRNTPIPTIKKRTYATVYHNQISLEIAVYQGNSSETKENTFLDSIILNHIPAAPAGKQNVSVCFNIDANGILNVSAELVSTGDKKSIQIEGLKGLRIEEKKIIRFEDSRDNWFKNLIQKLLKEGNNQVCNNKRFK